MLIQVLARPSLPPRFAPFHGGKVTDSGRALSGIRAADRRLETRRRAFQVSEVNGPGAFAPRSPLARAVSSFAPKPMRISRLAEDPVAPPSARPISSTTLPVCSEDSLSCGRRQVADDQGDPGGLAPVSRPRVMVIRKRATTPHGIKHNFGAARPEVHKAVRLMDLAEQFNLPVLPSSTQAALSRYRARSGRPRPSRGGRAVPHWLSR